NDQRLRAGCNLALRANDLDRSKSSDLDLLAVVAQGAICKLKRALLYLHVLVGVDQVPVDVLDLGNRRDDLRLERSVRDLLVVLCLDDESTIVFEPPSLEKVLT